MDAPLISFLIPVKNDARRLGECLASISRNALALPPGTIEVIVGDNGSSDGSADVARGAGARVLFLPGITVSALRNRLAVEARSDLLAFVDADHTLEAGWLDAALGAPTMAGVVALGAPCHAPSSKTWVQEAYDSLRRRASALEPVRWLGSGNLVVDRAAFLAVGGFDESLTACEDVDLCNRLRAAGGKIVSDPRLRSVHHGDPATLARLFRAERWRGRDNLRVSLRGPITPADVPSIAIPIAQAAVMAFLPIGLALSALGAGPAPAALAFSGIGAALALSALRAVALLQRGRLRGPAWWARALAFALVYDSARSIALLLPAGHHRDPAPRPRRVRPPIRVLELRSVFGTGGGPEKTILLGAARADPARFAVTVCYVRDARDPVFAIGERAAPLGVDYVEVVERGSFDPSIIGALRRLIRRRRIDILHAHDYKTNVLALLLARLEGLVPLTTAHGYTGNSRRERSLYYPLDKRILRSFPLVIAVSEDLRETAIAHGARPGRVRTVLNGIDHERFRRDRSREAAVRASLGVRPGEVVIGSVGRAARQKRFDLLLRAFAEVARRRPGLRLLIAGDGEERPSLERLADDLGVGRAALLGHRADIAELHHAFDLFVQSSDYEGTPNAVLEAMAFETPLVATTAGGTAQLVEDGVHGLLLAPGDASALARRIEKALADPEGRRRRAEAARARVEGELSFDARMRKVEAIYDELMATQPTPRTRLRVLALPAPPALSSPRP
jgi:glycosyltransferase involved in cell wall biosynthesis/GT2 family glycosyltransferase